VRSKAVNYLFAEKGPFFEAKLLKTIEINGLALAAAFLQISC